MDIAPPPWLGSSTSTVARPPKPPYHLTELPPQTPSLIRSSEFGEKGAVWARRRRGRTSPKLNSPPLPAGGGRVRLWAYGGGCQEREREREREREQCGRAQVGRMCMCAVCAWHTRPFWSLCLIFSLLPHPSQTECKSRYRRSQRFLILIKYR